MTCNFNCNQGRTCPRRVEMKDENDYKFDLIDWVLIIAFCGISGLLGFLLGVHS